MSEDLARYICTNHSPSSVIFEIDEDVEDPKCPVCNHSEFAYGYQGKNKPNVNTIRKRERCSQGLSSSNNFKTSPDNTPSASVTERLSYAEDEQDILPGQAPPGEETTGHHKRRSKTRKKPGPKKKHPRDKADWMPNKFGKHPLSSAMKKYLNATQKYYAPITQRGRTRKLKMICYTVVKMLGASPQPQKVSEQDIFNYMDWLDKQGIANSTQRKYIRFLKDYLAYYDNDVVVRMLNKKMVRYPKEVPTEIRSLSLETVKEIHQATKSMKGWEGSVARFITVAYPYTGLRPSELRTMLYEDIDTEAWTLRVSHPKGESLYGKKRRIGILPALRPAFIEFLENRKDYLEKHGMTKDFEALIPYKGRKGMGYWTSQALNGLKRQVEKRAGFPFKLKDYRASFCQIAIDLGAELPAVSKIMGHSTSTTTERYYGRIRDDTAIKEIERAFAEPLLEV